MQPNLKNPFLTVGIAFLAIAATTANANLIVNGDFEAGATGFSSGYANDQTLNGLAGGGEGGGAGEYAVGSNPQSFHSSFINAPDHTGGAGVNMMVVNGSGVLNKIVWSQTVSPPLVVGSTYLFTAWVMNVYPDSPANLSFSFGGNSLGSITPTGVGVWQQFTASFVAANSTGGLIDLNLAPGGNDFALDDISLVAAVPEPSTYIAGALLLLPFGAQTLRHLRSRKLVA